MTTIDLLGNFFDDYQETGRPTPKNKNNWSSSNPKYAAVDTNEDIIEDIDEVKELKIKQSHINSTRTKNGYHRKFSNSESAVARTTNFAAGAHTQTVPDSVHINMTTNSDEKMSELPPNPNARPNVNPFDRLCQEMDDNFKCEEKNDPQEYMSAYKAIKNEIKFIDANVKNISHLRGEYLICDDQQASQGIMDKLNRIMVENSKHTRTIKQMINTEKDKNQSLERQEGKSHSSILMWRINQLNSCIRKFKTASTQFADELRKSHNTLRSREKTKLREFDENGELTEADIEDMIDDPAKASKFLVQKFEMWAVGDMMVDELVRLEKRHEGMMRIEQSMQDLHLLIEHLHILVSAQQEGLDNIQTNVDQSLGYVESATKHLESAEKHQKCTRKMGCCLLCYMVMIAIVLIIIFLPSMLGSGEW